MQDTLILPPQFLGTATSLQRQLIAPLYCELTTKLVQEVAPVWSKQILESAATNADLSPTVSPSIAALVNSVSSYRSVLALYTSSNNNATKFNLCCHGFIATLARGSLIALFYGTAWQGESAVSGICDINSASEGNNTNSTEKDDSREASTTSVSGAKLKASQEKLAAGGNIPKILGGNKDRLPQLRADLKRIHALADEVTGPVKNESLESELVTLKTLIACLKDSTSISTKKSELLKAMGNKDLDLTVAVTEFLETLEQ